MPPPSTPPSRRRDALATRDRLIRAATELFATRGFLATTTFDIAERAETTETTMYRHVASKDQLFNEAYRAAMQLGLSLVRASEVERATGVQGKLGALARQVVTAAAREPAAMTLLLRPALGVGLDDVSQALAREYRQALTQLVASGKQEGTVRPGSAELWASVWLAIVTYVAERIIAREWTPDHSSATAAVAAAWDAIAYRGERASAGGAGSGAGPPPG